MFGATFILVNSEQNCMVWTMQSFELFDKKWLTIFWQSVDAILEDVLWLKQLFDAKPFI